MISKSHLLDIKDMCIEFEDFGFNIMFDPISFKPNTGLGIYMDKNKKAFCIYELEEILLRLDTYCKIKSLKYEISTIGTKDPNTTSLSIQQPHPLKSTLIYSNSKSLTNYSKFGKQYGVVPFGVYNLEKILQKNHRNSILKKIKIKINE